MANRKISQAGLDLIKQFEGCRLVAYQCSAGVWTIGYGHTAGVHRGMKITQAQAEAYLKQDVAKFEKYVNNASYVPFTDKLNQNQFDALVSFAFNLGQGNLMKLCKGRTINQVPVAMPQYCKANGKTLPGLQRRRKAEATLYNKKVQSCTCNYETDIQVRAVVHGTRRDPGAQRLLWPAWKVPVPFRAVEIHL